MTFSNYFYLIVIALVLLGWHSPVSAEDDVNIVTAPASTAKSAGKKKTTTSTEDTAVVHKSLHKKKSGTSSADTATTQKNDKSDTSSNDKASTSKTATPSSATAGTGKKETTKATASASPKNDDTSAKPLAGVAQADTPTARSTVKGDDTTKTKPTTSVGAASSATSKNSSKASSTAGTTKTTGGSTATTSSNTRPTPPASSAGSPTVETGLPVARRSVSVNPADLPQVPASFQNLPGAYQQVTANDSAPGTAVVAMTSASQMGAYTGSRRLSSAVPQSDFVFTNYVRKTKNVYPWKTGIITTMFWIGEGGSSISSTANIDSAWVENWREANRGTDTPYDRNGYAPANHAATVNTFYIALPFNDLAFPDKARRWLPPGWRRPDKDGRQVSACKDRWVEIKNAQGRPCYAQWEDVGPLRYDHAEYVFGNERPNTYTRAGLDVSPAVAQYLDIHGKNAITSWRFVDDEDVPPGAWLKYEEQAVIYNALHQQRKSGASSIQRASDPSDDDSNKRKTSEAKG